MVVTGGGMRLRVMTPFRLSPFRVTFLAANGHTTSAPSTTNPTEWVQHRKGNELTVRPGSVVAPQTLYTGNETRPNGQEVQHAIFLNARMLVHNPATGEPGMRNGHVVAHLYLAPTADKPWDLEVPYPSAAQVQTALTTYGPSVHKEVERIDSPASESLPASPSPTPVPASESQLPIFFPSPPSLELKRFPVHQPTPRRPSTAKTESYRFLTYPPGMAPKPVNSPLIDPGLIDGDTGHEVLLLPASSNPTHLAASRPGTPGLPRRMFETRPERLAPNPKRVNSDVSMEDAPPRKTRRCLDKADMAVCEPPSQRWPTSNVRAEKAQYEELRRALAKKLVIPDPPLCVFSMFESRTLEEAEHTPRLESAATCSPTSEEDADGDTDEEYTPPNPVAAGRELIAALERRMEDLRGVETDSDMEEGECSGSEEIRTGSRASPPPLLSPTPTRDEQLSRPSTPFTRDLTLGRSLCLSPIAEGAENELADHFACAPPSTPRLGPLLDPRSPRPLTTPVIARRRPPLRLPGAYSYASDDIPPLTDVSSDSDDFRFLQEVDSDYFAGVSPIVSDRGNTPFPRHRSSQPPVVVDEAELRSELKYIQHSPSPAVDPNERTLDWVRMQAISQQQDEAVLELEASENNDIISPLMRGAAIATRALELLDISAMERGEKINIDTYRHGVDFDEEKLHDEQERAVEQCLDLVTVKCEDGTRRVRDDYGIAISDDGTRFRLLSADAMMRRAMYRLALRLLSMPRLHLITFFVELRACLVDFIRSAAALLRIRRRRYDLTQLHNLAHIPPPYLFGHEYALLRLIYYCFLEAGHFAVIEAIEGILRLRFQEPAVVTHFLYGGLLDTNDTYYKPGAEAGTRVEKSGAGTRLTKDWTWEEIV
ncbi:hypothetical protein C8R47DRAFT_1223938 [Mycena vitilis]|nr:hypothetical protein C8R47DRAFT_1223938 [Mycena vitilis]